MNTSNSRRILIAVDGSEHALEAARYAGAILNPNTTEVVLYHALKKIDEAFWHIGTRRAFSEEMIDMKGWEAAQDEAISTFMNEIRQIFIEKGFAQDTVQIDVRPSEQGIARDIIKESKEGYSGVFLGRKGVSKLKDLVLGGTAQKLIERTAHIPVCVVDKGAEAGTILIAMDVSEGAMKAVDYAAAMFGDTRVEIRLVHVRAVIGSFEPRYGFTYTGVLSAEGEKWLEEERQEMTRVFEKAENKLVSAGLDRARISTNMLTDEGSRAGAMIREARETGYGGIVIGRRGISKIEEFFMGSMSHKVLQMGKGLAVWIVS